MTKPLNIGLIGYGFMGRAHSNAYRQVSQFFDLEYQPVLKLAVLAMRKTSKPSPKIGGGNRTKPIGGN